MNKFRYNDMSVSSDDGRANLPVVLLRSCDYFKGPHKHHIPLPSIESEEHGNRLVLTFRAETKWQYDSLYCQLFERVGGAFNLSGVHYDIMQGDGCYEGRLIIDF